MNHGADGVAQLDALAGVVEAARILPGDIETASVPALEGGDVSDDEAIIPRHQLEAAEREVDPVGERDEIEIDRLDADVGQLDVLRIRIVGTAGIGRMIHNLADPQALNHRPHRKHCLIQRTPGIAAERAGLDANAPGERQRAGVSGCRGRERATLGGAGASRGEHHGDEEVRTRGRAIQSVNGQKIFASLEILYECRDVDLLELAGLGIGVA